MGERLTVDVGGDERGGQVVGGVFDPVGGELVHQLGELLARVDEGHHRVGALGDVLGIAAREDHVGAAEDRRVVRGRDTHHVADDLEGEGCGDLGDEVALAEPGHPVDHPVGDRLDGLLDAGDPPRVERGGDDAPQPGVARVVGRDHAGEVLDHLGGRSIMLTAPFPEV